MGSSIFHVQSKDLPDYMLPPQIKEFSLVCVYHFKHKIYTLEYAANNLKIEIRPQLEEFYKKLKKQLEKEYVHNNDFYGTVVQKSDEGKVQLKVLFWEKL
jgi:hypothetical protein